METYKTDNETELYAFIRFGFLSALARGIDLGSFTLTSGFF
ncbi:hypothetical protein [Lacticigenium naphthae]|nr:hypothetical protein [Lacticigenium naphthae]